MSGSGPYGTGPGPIEPGSGRAGGSGPPSRRPGGGLRVLAFLVAGLGVAAVLTCAVAGVVLWRSPEFREAMTLLEEGRVGPGVEALEQSGCQTAVVLDAQALLAVVGGAMGLDLAGLEEGETPPELAGPVVVCMLPEKTLTPGCEQVAQVYLGAVEEVPERFVVTVAPAASTRPLCQEVFDADGTRLGSLEELSADEGS